jgi:hypothetical protein
MEGIVAGGSPSAVQAHSQVQSAWGGGDAEAASKVDGGVHGLGGRGGMRNDIVRHHWGGGEVGGNVVLGLGDDDQASRRSSGGASEAPLPPPTNHFSTFD